MKILRHIVILTSLLSLGHFASAARTATEQANLTPKEILQQLMEGNERFQKGYLTQRNYLAEAASTAGGQYPVAAIISCLDSRVPVEVVFDQGIGDVFVGRVAGNVEDADMLGSLEFATKVAGSKVIMVLGHEACGAVKGAIADVELGNLTQLLEKIQPAIKTAKKTSKDKDGYLDAVIHANVAQTIADIRSRSTVIAELEAAGDLILVGAYYSLEDGKVTLLDHDLAHALGHSHNHGH